MQELINKFEKNFPDILKNEDYKEFGLDEIFLMEGFS